MQVTQEQSTPTPQLHRQNTTRRHAAQVPGLLSLISEPPSITYTLKLPALIPKGVSSRSGMGHTWPFTEGKTKSKNNKPCWPLLLTILLMVCLFNISTCTSQVFKIYIPIQTSDFLPHSHPKSGINSVLHGSDLRPFGPSSTFTIDRSGGYVWTIPHTAYPQSGHSFLNQCHNLSLSSPCFNAAVRWHFRTGQVAFKALRNLLVNQARPDQGHSSRSPSTLPQPCTLRPGNVLSLPLIVPHLITT